MQLKPLTYGMKPLTYGMKTMDLRYENHGLTV